MNSLEQSLFEQTIYATIADMRRQPIPTFKKVQYCTETNSMFVWQENSSLIDDGRVILSPSEARYSGKGRYVEFKPNHQTISYRDVSIGDYTLGTFYLPDFGHAVIRNETFVVLDNNNVWYCQTTISTSTVDLGLKMDSTPEELLGDWSSAGLEVLFEQYEFPARLHISLPDLGAFHVFSTSTIGTIV